jgi:hypothetical protein
VEAERNKVEAERNKVEAAREQGIATGIEKGIEKGEWFERIRALQESLGDVVATSEELRAWDDERLKSTTDSLQARLRGKS